MVCTQREASDLMESLRTSYGRLAPALRDQLKAFILDLAKPHAVSHQDEQLFDHGDSA